MIPLLLVSLVAHLARVPFADAQGTNATCNAGFDWMSNSKGQSPCLVSSWLFTPCSAPADSWVFPLSPGFHYNTPDNSSQSATPCRCNTVLFSTIAACATCQGQGDFIVPWTTYSQFCSPKYIQKYPQGIPSGTAIPAWAYLDITVNGTFDAEAALAVANENLPESTAAGTPTSTSASATGSSTSGTSASTTSAPSQSATDGTSGNSSGGSSSKPSNIGPIVGGVVGGVVGLLAVGLAVFFFLRHRRNKERQPSQFALPQKGYEPGLGQYQVPQYGDKTPDSAQPFLQQQQASPRLYDPNDPNTFPISDPYATSTRASTAYPATEPTIAVHQNPTYKGVPEL